MAGTNITNTIEQTKEPKAHEVIIALIKVFDSIDNTLEDLEAKITVKHLNDKVLQEPEIQSLYDLCNKGPEYIMKRGEFIIDQIKLINSHLF